MTVSQSPILRNADAAKNKYRGFALQQMAILKSYMKTAGLTTCSRVVRLYNGVVVTCEICFNRESIFIDVPEKIAINDEVERTFSGVVFRPRSGKPGVLRYSIFSYDGIGTRGEAAYVDGIRGSGWTNGAQEIILPEGTSQYDYPIYPLVDGDNAFFSILKGKEDTYDRKRLVLKKSISIESEGFLQGVQFGNLFWTNDATYNFDAEGWDKEFDVVSWNGPASRHFRIPSEIDIGGYSQFETSVKYSQDDLPQYTAFGKKVYQGGYVLRNAPEFSWPYNPGVKTGSFVLGASQEYTITLNDHYNAPAYNWTFSDGHNVLGDKITDALKYRDDRNKETPTPVPPIKITNTTKIKKTGYFLGVWTTRYSTDNFGIRNLDKCIVGDCELIAEFEYSKKGLPFFGNADQTKFVSSNGDLIEILTNNGDTSCTLILATTQVGSYSESATDATYYPNLFQQGPGWIINVTTLTVTASVPTSMIYFEYNKNVLANMETSFDFSITPATNYKNHIMTCNHKMFVKNENGVTEIPILQSHRNWTLTYSGLEKDAWNPTCTCKEDYEITKSYLHYVDSALGVVLYFKVREYVVFDITSTETQRIKQPWAVADFHEIKIKTSNFVSKRIEEWHLLIDGIDSVLTSHEGDLSPFPDVLISGGTEGTTMADYISNGNYIGLGGSIAPFNPNYIPDFDIRQILLFPQPASIGIPWTDDIRFFGFYDYGHQAGDESALNIADGGNKDMFFPEWCRNLQTNQIMIDIAARRYAMNWYHEGMQPSVDFRMPSMNENYIPIGSFVRHPIVGDVYQFLISDGNQKVAWTSPSLATGASESEDLTSIVNKSLEKSLNEAGERINEGTHDITLFYPISII